MNKFVMERLLPMAVMLLIAGAAHASSSVRCTGGGTVVLSLPATITVPASATKGQLLSTWVATTMPVRYSCSINVSSGSCSSGGSRTTLVYSGGKSITDTTVTAPDAGHATIAVFESGVPGIGIAVAGANYSSYTIGCGSSPVASCSYYKSYSATTGVVTAAAGGLSCGGSGTESLRERVAIALVRTTGAVGSGTIDLDGVVIARSQPSAWAALPPAQYFGTVPETNYTIGGKTSVVRPACTTSNVEVDFGSVDASRFTGVGSTPAQRDFNLALTSCPAGTSMTYQLDPVITPISATDGVLALKAGGATGLGVRVRRLSGSTESTLAFGTAYDVPGFSGLAGNYTVPLRAALYQTAPTVSPGKVEAEATFTIDYR